MCLKTLFSAFFYSGFKFLGNRQKNLTSNKGFRTKHEICENKVRDTLLVSVMIYSSIN